MAALDLFLPHTRRWFDDTFAAPTPAQEEGWPAIAGGAHTLIHAPTGSGKTLAAFLWGLDRLFAEPVPEERRRCRVLYVSPMKALAYDVERNLRSPLTGIRRTATVAGGDLPLLTTAMRTGDTPADERRRMQRTPPDVLITTPESLYLMLTSAVREIFAPVRWVIVDEIHSVASTKRGSHLALSLERLEELTEASPQRIGLSATQRPLDEIARFLGGGDVAGDGWSARPVTVVDAPADKELDLEIVVPVADMTRPEESAGDADGPPTRSIWPAVYPRLLDQVLGHRSTIIFANSRSLAERIASELNGLADEEIARAHHGSVSREQRLDIEDRLKRGELRCVVATSSLELGIDMAAVDLVLLVESPTTVARGLQRVGRAGHQVGAASKAKVFPKHRGDLLEAAVVVDRMYAGEIEATAIPRNPLDVLAQQLVAAVAMESRQVDELYDLVRRAYPYHELGRASYESVLDMLAGRYPSDEFAELRPRLTWDRVEGTLEPRGNARMLAVTNPGTIPDRGLYTVSLPEGGRVGELDEEMVYESRPGDTFVLGSSSWQISEIDHDRVTVVPAPPDAHARMPFWHGDTMGRPLELGRALGAFLREMAKLEPEQAETRLSERYRLDGWAAHNLARFLADEGEATGHVPSDRTIVIERFRDEIGDWRMVLLSPFGSRVHAPWAMAAKAQLRQRHGIEADAIWADDGIVFRFPDVDEPPPPTELVVTSEEAEPLIIDEVGDTALFSGRFREAAARSLLLPRRRPGQRTPLWLQRRRSADLLSVSKRYGSFPIVLETYREVLQQYFDVPALTEVLGDIAARRVRVVDVDLAGPSPFASSLLFDFVASFMYEYDAPVAERRAAALTLDRELLRELLGEPELRDLLDPDVVAAVELELQRLTPDRAARGIDGVHDLLRDLGPLTTEEVAARTEEAHEVAALLAELEAQRRVVVMRIGGGDRWAAVEDVARLRDALGAVPPRGVPEAFLDPVADPLGDVVGRFARTHGPFTSGQAAAALGLPAAAVGEILGRLEAGARVTRGAFRPAGEGQEWVDTEVLRRLRRRSLAALRKEVEPVVPADFGRFLPEWHGLGRPGSGRDRLLETVRRLQGAAIPASILESDVLPARLAYNPAELDTLATTGELVWVGRGALGARDGRVALYLRDQVPLLHLDMDVTRPDGPGHASIRRHLEDRGASFFRDVYDAAGGGDPEEVLDALWDLVWAGEVTNDTLAPLRAFLWGKARRRSGGRRQLPTASPPAGSGRWYLVSDLLGATTPPAERRATAWAEQLLERHGVVTRDAVLAEGIPGGFAGLYPVFATMEDAGRVRRGYFVEGLGGAQFAAAGAVDRLRQPDDDTPPRVLAAADPANPYGAALPWPETRGSRAGRSAGARVVLVAGRLVLFVERGGRRVLTFTDAETGLEAAARALAGVARGLRRLSVETVNGEPAGGTRFGELLTEHGFVTSYKGLAFRG